MFSSKIDLPTLYTRLKRGICQSSLYPYILIPVLIWIGFVCSISFMEAWLKFRAPNVSLSTGLSIGRVIFAALNTAEWILAGLSMFFLLLSKGRLKQKNSLLLCTSVFILAIQTIFLLPVLDTRAELIIHGRTVLPSFSHLYYVALEVLKVVSLFMFGISVISGLKCRDQVESPQE